MALWHRPTKKQLQLIQEKKGLQLLITCQCEREFSNEIKKDCQHLSIENIHIPLEGANQALLSNNKTIQLLSSTLISIYDIIQKEKDNQNGKFNILIHCAAGIHRTGIVSYSLLRMCGYDEQQSLEQIKQMRQETFKGVGDHRIKYAEEMVVQKLLNQLQQQTQVKNN